MTTIASQHSLKQPIRSIMIASLLFVVVGLVALFVQNYRTGRGASTVSPSQESSSPTVAPGSQAGRPQSNPLRAFRR